MSHWLAWVLLVACSPRPISSQEDSIRIVSVVDQTRPEDAVSLRNGVDYLNSPWNTDPLGRPFIMDTILSTSNDSYAALDQMCALLGQGPAMIVDVSSRQITSTLGALADDLGIAHVTGIDQSWEGVISRGTSVNVRAPGGEMLKVIRDIVSHENITTAAIIYDWMFDLSAHPKNLLANLPVQHLYIKMAATPQDITQQLEKIMRLRVYHIFLAASAANIERVLSQANNHGMMDFKYYWHVLTKDSVVECAGCERTSSFIVLSAVAVPEPAQKYINFMNDELGAFSTDDLEVRAAFLFDLMTMVGHTLGSLLREGNWHNPVYSDCSSLPSSDPATRAQAQNLLEQLISMSHSGTFGDYTWVNTRTAHQQLRLHITRDEYSGGQLLSTQQIGEWSTSSGLDAHYGTLTDTDLRVVYRVVTVEEPPFVFKSRDRPPGIENVYFQAASGWYYYGYCIDFIFELEVLLGFDVKLVEPSDGAYGTRQPDGSWNGMIRELLEDNADIIVAPLSVMSEREVVIDYTVPYYDLVGITILMKKPSYDVELFRFMSVLESSVWGCIFTAFLLICVLISVFDRLSPFSFQNRHDAWPVKETPRLFTIRESMWFCMTSLTPQGGGEAPRALSGRLVSATWWMFGFIMVATYVANLGAFLTVSRLDQPISSLEDLADQYAIQFAPQASSATETYFYRMKQIEDKFYQIWKDMSLDTSLSAYERAQLAIWDYPVADRFSNMWNAMQATGLPNNFTEALNRIKTAPEDQGFAFIGDATQCRYASLMDCDLWEVGEEFSKKPYALAVQQGSPLKDTLSLAISRLIHERVLEHLQSFWWSYDLAECPRMETSGGIGMDTFGGVFFLILIGIGLGLVALLYEFYWYRWRQAPAEKQPDKVQLSNASVEERRDTDI